MAPIPEDIGGIDELGNNAVPSYDNNSLQALADEEDSSQPSKSWIYAPLIVFMLIALAIVLIQFRRRRRKVTNNLMLREALARDIAALSNDPNRAGTERIYIIRTSANGQPQEVTTAAGGRVRSGGLGLRPSRWQWSIPIPGRRHQEEGLNEFGEAPPPYDASKTPAVPLNEVRRASDTLSRISEEEGRDNTNQSGSVTRPVATPAPDSTNPIHHNERLPPSQSPPTNPTIVETAPSPTPPPPAYIGRS